MRTVLPGLLAGLLAAFPHPAAALAATVLPAAVAGAGWLLAQPAAVAAAVAYATIRGLRARPRPVRATGRKGGPR
jgi:hypothetical protein